MTKLDRTKADADEERALRAVSALLRDLPDPQPPDGLVERVMTRVAEREARPRVIRGLFRGVMGQPTIASALAAGIGCLLLVSAFQGELLRPAQPTHLEPMEARRIGSVDTAQLRQGAGPSIAPPITPRVVVDPQAAGFFAGPPQPVFSVPTVEESRPDVADVSELLDRRLDHQLNALLLDPAAFYARLDRLRAPEPFVARLTERAARRGDAVDVALKLRQRSPEHPDTAWLVDRLLRAALARHVAQ